MQKIKKTSRINSTINVKLDKKFRDCVARFYGMKKGNLQKALEEAIIDWIKQQKNKPRHKNSRRNFTEP